LKAIGICMLIVCWLGFTNAWAQEKASKNVLNKSITFYGGIQFYQADGQFGYAKEGSRNVKLDMKDLGLDETESSPIAGAVINFGRRLTLRLDYYGYHDKGKRSADYEFDFAGNTYPVGARLDTSLDIDLYVVNLSYNFIRTERARFGVGFGVHAADIKLEVSGKAYAGNLKTDLGSGNEELLAPLPNFYVMGAYCLTDRLLVRAGGGGMSLNYGDWEGTLYFGSAFVEYWPFRYAGLGAGYRYLSADIDYDPGHKKETYDVDLPGPVFYITVGF